MYGGKDSLKMSVRESIIFADINSIFQKSNFCVSS